MMLRKRNCGEYFQFRPDTSTVERQYEQLSAFLNWARGGNAMGGTDTQASVFVLVHGGRHGGWCWRWVARELRRAGNIVYTPTLTGLGERAHLLSPGIGLDTHVQDVVGVFEYEDLTDAVLVSHSYGGMVSSGAMERVADRVRQFVLVDAHLPREGESLMDLVGDGVEPKVREMVAREGEGWFLPTEDASFWGLRDAGQIAWVNSKVTPQPFKTYTDPSGPTGRAWAHPGTFIECQPSMNNPVELARLKARSDADPRFRYRTMAGGHEPMVTSPSLLTSLLLEAAS
jgi:pimeloyl-ACP methyl ester carboxylesterase